MNKLLRSLRHGVSENKKEILLIILSFVTVSDIFTAHGGFKL